ncbi:dihydrodipicolinate synthase family protein [Natrialbaceae archaeon A-CW2]
MKPEVAGVIPAALVPFTDDQAIHEEGYCKHIGELAAHNGVDGILCNGHAGEIYALRPDERERIVELAVKAAPNTPIYSGVGGATTEAVLENASAVVAAGADAVMVDPPLTPIHGRREAAIDFFEAIVEGIDIPIVLFQIAARSGRNYSADLLAELASLDGIVAIKEGVWEVDHTMADVEAVRAAAPRINYLMGNDEHLLPCYALGVDGTVVELGAAFPNEIASMYHAVDRGDLETAREIDRKLGPLLDVIYQDPKHDSSIRLKVALELQGRLPTSSPRRPATPIPADERDAIRETLDTLDMLAYTVD